MARDALASNHVTGLLRGFQRLKVQLFEALRQLLVQRLLHGQYLVIQARNFPTEALSFSGRMVLLVVVLLLLLQL